MSGKKFTVCVEGNIGCGKSSFIRYFRDRMPHLCVLEEPVPLWTNLDNNNLLGMMYTDTKRWSTVFQAYVMLTMSDRHSVSPNSPGPQVALLERSLHSAVNVFVENLHRQGLMEEMDYHILKEWYAMWIKEHKYDIDLIIYLKARPSVCLQRVQRRDRQEECGLSVDLLQQLHSLHEDWLLRQRCGVDAARVVVVDAEKDLATLQATYDEQIVPLLSELCSAEC